MPRALKYPEITSQLRARHVEAGPLTIQEAKEFIGWQEEPKKEAPHNGEVVPEPEKFGNDFVLKDVFGRKIRLLNNPSNRPFKLPLAQRYCNEMLRGKWALNLETIVLDRFGFVQQGQHRLVGFILAEQERLINTARWGSKPVTLEVLMGFGVSEKPEVANTYDLGAKRSLADVLYRHQKFGRDVSDKEQQRTTKILSSAIRLVWLRLGGQQLSFAPHFPHSEAISFYEQHPGILESVQAINTLDEDGNISVLITPGHAAALHYLMTGAKSAKKRDEFWSLFTTGAGLEAGNPVLVLRSILAKKDGGNSSQRDEIIGLVVKAWLAWLAGEKVASKQLALKKSKDGDRFILAEVPRMGGLDVVPEVKTKVNKYQILLLNTLRKLQEGTYAQLAEATGLQTGQCSRALIAVSANGKEYNDTLEALGYVEAIRDREKEGGGKAPIVFRLTDHGKEAIKSL